MKKAYLISTGTELLLGSTIDTNSIFLAEKLGGIGIKVIGKSIVGDNEDSITGAFETGMKLADVIISTGGLGPTTDDLTKEVASRVTNSKLELIDEELKRLKGFFARRNREMTDNNIKQAMFPKGATILKNLMGTAPGMYISKNQKVIILLPGPPKEMGRMYTDEVAPLLIKEYGIDVNRAVSKTIKIFGPGESKVEQLLAEVMNDSCGCSIALLAKEGEVHVKITSEGKDVNQSQKILQALTDNITMKLNKNVIGFDDDTLVSKVSELLINQGNQ